MKRIAGLDRGWLVVLLAHTAIFGGILIHADFLPYTFDNNESFSAFWHARNMYEYGAAKTAGLADEAFSYDAAAHPYVYTHAGASPRLFAYLLYALGVRTIELQIAVTVLVVGLLAFWLVYRFLAEVATRFYAAVACLLLMTDYVMFTQWHFVAWQVWKTLLLFGALYLAHLAAARRLRRPLLAVYAFHAFLFYYETIFNVYVALAAFFYFVFVSRDYRFAVKLGAAQLAGALTAAAILVGQGVIQFGWDVLLADAYYTFIGRNYATDVVVFREAAKAFYANHNIVFWMNIPEIGQYRSIGWALRILFQDHAVHTPPWSLVVLAFAVAHIMRSVRAASGRPSMLASTGKPGTVAATFLFGTLLAGLFALLVRNPELGVGLAPMSPFWASRRLLMVAAAGGASFALAAALAPPSVLAALDRRRIVIASAFVAGALAFIIVQQHLYTPNPALEPIWRLALARGAGYTSGGALLVSATIALAAWHAAGSSAGSPRPMLSRLLLACAALLAAYFLIYFVFTGYVYTGYSARYVPFTVYVNALLLAVGVVAMIDCAREWYTLLGESQGWYRIVCGANASAAAVTLAGALFYWGALQVFLFRKLPPDTISFLPILSTPPFQGRSFTGTFYGATVAYFTKKWAYHDFDSLVGNGQVRLRPDGYHMERDYGNVWFADRAVNRDYLKPDYYLAMTYKGMALNYLRNDTALPAPRAGDVPLVKAAREGRTGYLHPVEVARDPSPRDRWSIVKLDWDYPPFLREVSSGETVTLEVSPFRSGTRIRVNYRYAHQEGTREAGTQIALFAHTGCRDAQQTLSVAPVAAGASEFVLPRGFRGTVHAEVRPATATKAGPTYGSQALGIGSLEVCSEA